MNVNKLRQRILKTKLDGLLVTNKVNVAYLAGFKGEGQLLITPAKKILLVDFRFKQQAVKEAKSWQVSERSNFRPPEEAILRLVKKLKLKRLGFESGALSYGFYHKLSRTLLPVKLAPCANMVEQLRAIKSAEEIRLLKKAAGLAAKSYAFAKKLIKPGRSEEEIAREVEYFMRALGCQSCAFETIVASGERSSMPHALTSGKVIKDNQAVLLDLGCRKSGYNSDLTRMVFLGKIGGKIKRNFKIVLQAQAMAIKAIKAGVRVSQIDRIARQYIIKEGFGDFFGHALGHGIGREVHEYPAVSPENQDSLKQGMVLTIEPGIYIPGWGGVRVEDMVLVKQNGCELLTQT